MEQLLDGQPAVFSRNHSNYLKAAAQIARSTPSRLVVFRSHVAWATAQKLLKEFGPLDIFFAAIDDNGRVTYQARLQKVHLRPRTKDSTTRRLLRLRPPETKSETDWREGKGSIYAISHCRVVKRPFSQTKLVKISDDLPIARDYSRSYCLVLRPTDLRTDNEVADDTAEPQQKVRQVVVRRIVRDTAIVRRLKVLHKHRCQVCRETLRFIDGEAYSEGHHLRPLGGIHKGPDISGNILIVCPNCHAQLDMLGKSITYSSLRMHAEHRVAREHVSYHNALVSRDRIAT